MRVGLWTFALLCAGIAALPAQDGGPQPQDQPPTFVGGVQYVRVDLYVTRDGRLIDDLRIDEIELYEDGVRQRVEALERIEFRRPDAPVPALEPRTLEASRAAARDPRSRVFVVFLDRWHTGYVGGDSRSGDRAPLAQARFPLLRELEARLGPDDLVGVMTSGMQAEDVTFIRGLGGLAQVEGTWDRYSLLRPDPGQDLDAEEELYLACYPAGTGGSGLAYRMINRRREQMALDALEALADHLGALREERKAVLVVTDGWPLYLPDPSMLQRRPDDVTPRLPFQPPDGDRTVVISSDRGASELSPAARERCEARRATLAMLDHGPRLREIAARANRANVSFYPISPAGLTTALTPPGQVTRQVDARAGGALPAMEHATPQARQSALRELAEETDGLAVVNTNNVTGGVERIMADTSAYYLIGYTPTNAALDGRFRRITVRVNRPGVDVRARPGYLASPAPTRVREAGALDEPAAANPLAAAFAAIGAVDTRAALSLRASSWVPSAGPETGGMLWIAGELDAQTRREPAWRGGGTAEVSLVNADGATVLAQTVDVPSGGAAFVVRTPETGLLPPGEYSVRVRLQSDGTVPVTGALRASLAEDGHPLGEPVVWRRGPTTGPQYVPAADVRIRRNERLRLELPTASGAPVAARLLDRTGALLPVPAVVTERDDERADLRWVVVDVSVAPLAPGEYAVEVTQDGQSRLMAFRMVP